MSAAEQNAESGAAAGAAPSGGGGNKLVFLLTLVNLVGTLAMVAILFISFQRDKKKPAVEDIVAQEAPHDEGKKEGEQAREGGKEGAKEGAKKKTGEFGKMITLEQFVINLSTPGAPMPKFVRVNISLEVPNDEAENEVNQKMPEVRNAIIDLFNSKRPSDLATADGRDYLREEIKAAINGFMVTGKVKGVYFTNFVVTG